MFRNLVIAVAIFGLGWGASFGAGMALGRRGTAPQVQAANAPGSLVGQAGQGGQGGQGGQAGTGAQGRGGVVQAVDGRTLTLMGANNQQLKVTLTDQTQILKMAPGAPVDLAPGVRVAVQPQGQPAGDGTVTAAAVEIVPEGAAAGFAGGFGGQGGQRQGQGGQGAQRQQAPAGR